MASNHNGHDPLLYCHKVIKKIRGSASRCKFSFVPSLPDCLQKQVGGGVLRGKVVFFFSSGSRKFEKNTPLDDFGDMVHAKMIRQEPVVRDVVQHEIGLLSHLDASQGV